MFDFKLQIGCLLVIIYYLLLYIRDTTGNNKLKCQPLFDCILVIAPGVISVLMTVGFSGALYFVNGVNTNYSMGIPVYVCFALMIILASFHTNIYVANISCI